MRVVEEECGLAMPCRKVETSSERVDWREETWFSSDRIRLYCQLLLQRNGNPAAFWCRPQSKGWY